MIENDKIIILYCVSNSHFINYKIIEKLLHTYKIFYIYEKKFNLVDNKIISANKINIIDEENIFDFINNYKMKISYVFFSTAQLRYFPMKLH